MSIKKTFGWLKDLPDIRDYKFAQTFAGDLPNLVDLRSNAHFIYDQGQLGSCTANAVGGLYEMVQDQNGKPAYAPSRLFIYYNTRAAINTIGWDSGGYIRDAMKVAATQGCPKEAIWPYDIKKFKQKPLKKVYTEGAKHTVLHYSRIDNTNLNSIKTALALKYPVVIGFVVYESFASDQVAKTGIMPMPAKNEKTLGGHAVLIVGYNDATNRFIVRNSWGANWGDKGYFYAPYAYFTNPQLADDCWTATLAT